MVTIEEIVKSALSKVQKWYHVLSLLSFLISAG